METNKLKFNTILFFLNAMKDLHKGIDSALDLLNNNKLDEEQKFSLIVNYIGEFGMNQNLFITEVCSTGKVEDNKTEIGGPIQKYDYQNFPEERFEILLMNGLIGFNMPLN